MGSEMCIRDRVTHEVAEKKFMDAIKKFSSMEMVKGISSIIRVYALGNVQFLEKTDK